MKPVGDMLPSVGGRRAILALGGVYTVLGVVWSLAQVAGDASPQVGLIIAVLVGGSGAVLLYGGFRLPQTDIHSSFFPTIAEWCFRGIGVIVGILFFIEIVTDLTAVAANFLILSALGAVAGFGVGRHDARARSRAYVLEQRNEELQQTQAELEETVEQLEASEQRYRTVTENFPNGAVSLLNSELRHELIAGKGFEKLDIGASDLRGERIQDVYPAELLEVIEPHYRATLDGEATSFEVPIQGRTFEFRTHPLTGVDDVYAFIATSQDVTERKQRERELSKQANQQQVVADLGQFALESDDLDELMAEASRRVADVLDTEYCKVLDLDEASEELRLRQGVGWDDGLVGEAAVSAVEADSQAAYTLEKTHSVVVEDLETETRFSGPDLLTDHDVQSGISTVVGPSDEPWGILGTHDTESHTFSEEDISFVQSVANILAEAIERDQYQTELEGLVADLGESNERLEQFAYAASHDLQEPLRMVSSYLQLLEDRYGNELDDEAGEFIGFAVDGADRMRHMIEGLLQYSRVETHGSRFEPVDLDDVVADVREDLDVQIEESDAEVVTEALPRVTGDESQLGQVLQNLLKNAIAYSGDEPPRVHISAEQNGTECEVSVRDEGVGIDPAEQERIFEVFQRLHARDDQGGSGIGLALCERIVERHGGDIWVDSEPGEGATFSFTLPVVTELER